jgi:hypothetical protein
LPSPQSPFHPTNHPNPGSLFLLDSALFNFTRFSFLVPTYLGSGLNDHRRQLEKLLKQEDYNVLVVEHRDRKRQVLSNYLDVLLSRVGITLEIVNLAENGRDDLISDLVAIIIYKPPDFMGNIAPNARLKRSLLH